MKHSKMFTPPVRFPMSRRGFLASAGLGAAGRLSAQRPSRPMNVILIMADDVGHECFSPYGSKQYSTPNLKRLAAQGVRFDHCYATPLCTPTRITLMTGQSNVRNYVDFGAMLPGQYTFANLFRGAGYATAMAGKWQLQGSADVKGVAPAEAGFDSYCLWNTSLTQRDRYWTPSIERNGKIVEIKDNDYGPDIFSRFLIDFIEEKRNQPFFVYYPMALPHSPFLPTPDSANRQSRDRQKNFEDMVAYVDKMVGRVADALDRLNLSSNTLLLFTSDNGTEHGIHSRLGERVIQGDKGAPTDAGTHVPLIVRGPGIAAGRVVNDLVDFTDFLPTLADSIGARLPEGLPLDGRSFWPQLTGKRGNPREWTYTYYFPRPYAKAYSTPYTHPEVRYARDHRFKLYGDGRMFDVQADPEEKQPLPAAGKSQAVQSARRKLQAAIDSMPAHGRQIPREHWQRTQGVKPPVW